MTTKCFECGSEADHRHHVVPKSLGGRKTVPMCANCHGKIHLRLMTTSSLARSALAAKRKAGERVGEVPFGWTLDAAGRLVEDADEQNVLAKIMACHAAGMSLRKIAAILTGAGIVTKKGNAGWSHSTVQSILERAAAMSVN